MTEEAQNEERDEVLFAFHRACERPSASDIIDWASRYPKYADDIRAHAAMLREADKADDDAVDADDEVFFARGRSHAQSALHDAKIETSTSVAPSSAVTFDQFMVERSIDIPKLAKEIDIARGVLSALMYGRMEKPVRPKLAAAIQNALRISLRQFELAFEKALMSPKLGHAKGSQSATIHRQACDDIIRDSSMSDERKAYWLTEE